MQTLIDRLVLVQHRGCGISVHANTDASNLLALQVYSGQLETIVNRTMQRALCINVRITGAFCALFAKG